VVASLAGFFGVLAVILAALGIYGVTAYAVSRRRAELGIRLALGASPAAVRRLVVRRVLILIGIGLGAGAAASAWLSRLLGALLYDVTPRDPVTFAGAAALLATIGILAAWVPAARASRIDPAEVLRQI
jgi:ABC-type antimicrobial peptide transport system permease subunit